MSFQQSINNAMSSVTQMKGIQALQNQTKIQAHEAQQRQMQKMAEEQLQTAADNKEAEGVKYPDNYDKATEYYVSKMQEAGAEPSLVAHQIHELAKEAAGQRSQ